MNYIDRDKARDTLALMKRGNSTQINGMRIEFDENGNFITWSGLKSGICTPSVKKVVGYLFGDFENQKKGIGIDLLPNDTLLKIAKAFYRRARKWDSQIADSFNHDEYPADDVLLMEIINSLSWLDFDGFAVIDKSAVSVLYQDAEEPENFTHDPKEVPALVSEHELGCGGIVQIDCISTTNISKKRLYCIYEMKTDGSMEGALKMCESPEEAEKILAANMEQINAHEADQCASYVEYEEEQKNASNYFLNFPNIRRAALLLWTDNGMINREEPLSEKEVLLWRWMTGLDQEYLARVNTALNFSDEDLATICNGEETEAQELLANEEAEAFLNLVFNEEYEPK
ncbi:hypothetical protein [Acinetobacter sp. ANC 3813]|uniref:hypothetical protein n=1 Tax=Acinetobacter sp. ANC 3813 TaxID=1977873 RepID=UPI000A35535A|nr:hypothetical protein [Acinetobacter sp. ANC 3813]OTG87832.1 hypothetical protein B9T34_15970 [Acinetobacter sp. ANC 3813]